MRYSTPICCTQELKSRNLAPSEFQVNLCHDLCISRFARFLKNGFFKPLIAIIDGSLPKGFSWQIMKKTLLKAFVRNVFNRLFTITSRRSYVSLTSTLCEPRSRKSRYIFFSGIATECSTNNTSTILEKDPMTLLLLFQYALKLS